MANKHKESDQPDNTLLSQTRRSALKKMLVGTGVAAGAAVLPDKWAKPIVDKVLVPAHAQTSDPCFYYLSCGIAIDEASDHRMLFIEWAYECPDGVEPADPTGIMVDITTEDSDPEDWPCPGNTSVALDFEGKASVQVGPCIDPDSPPPPYPLESLQVQVEFQDKAKWGTDSSTCSWSAGSPSDIRLKTDVYPLDVTEEGFKLYRFRYKNDPSGKAYVGVMAQDLTDSHPHALVKNDNGYYAVRYDLLGLKMTTYKEWQQAGLKAVELVH